MKQSKYELTGFSQLLACIAEEYHIAPTDVLLLLQEHSLECSSFFNKGESYANTINGKMMDSIEKELNEKPSEDNPNS